jgi:hypothetical protein
MSLRDSPPACPRDIRRGAFTVGGTPLRVHFPELPTPAVFRPESLWGDLAPSAPRAGVPGTLPLGVSGVCSCACWRACWRAYWCAWMVPRRWIAVIVSVVIVSVVIVRWPTAVSRLHYLRCPFYRGGPPGAPEDVDKPASRGYRTRLSAGLPARPAPAGPGGPRRVRRHPAVPNVPRPGMGQCRARRRGPRRPRAGPGRYPRVRNRRPGGREGSSGHPGGTRPAVGLHRAPPADSRTRAVRWWNRGRRLSRCFQDRPVHLDAWRPAAAATAARPEGSR